VPPCRVGWPASVSTRYKRSAASIRQGLITASDSASAIGGDQRQAPWPNNKIDAERAGSMGDWAELGPRQIMTDLTPKMALPCNHDRDGPIRFAILLLWPGPRPVHRLSLGDVFWSRTQSRTARTVWPTRPAGESTSGLIFCCPMGQLRQSRDVSASALRPVNAARSDDGARGKPAPRLFGESPSGAGGRKWSSAVAPATGHEPSCGTTPTGLIGPRCTARTARKCQREAYLPFSAGARVCPGAGLP